MFLECAKMGKGERLFHGNERGGDIHVDSSGNYFWIGIQTGSPNHVTYKVARDAVAAIHTHPPEKSKNINRTNQILTHQDLNMVRLINWWVKDKVPHYLGTPYGAIVKFEHDIQDGYGGPGTVIEPNGFFEYR